VIKILAWVLIGASTFVLLFCLIKLAAGLDKGQFNTPGARCRALAQVCVFVPPIM
jgi:hypothetical protein